MRRDRVHPEVQVNTSDRPDNIVYPGPAWRPSVAYAVKSARERLVTSPDMVLAQWYQAIINPAYLDSNDNPVLGKMEYVRTLVSNTSRPDGLWPLIVGAEEQMIRYYKQGTWPDGSVPITYYATDLPLAPFDWLIPYGVSGVCDGITFPTKENLARGQSIITALGSVSNTGSSVVGYGTGFTSLFSTGDLIFFGGSPFIVASVADDTHLTLSTTPSTNFTSVPYSKMVERLLYHPVASVTSLVDANNVTYVEGVAFSISTDLETIKWLSPTNQPTYNVRFGAAYTYRPIYEITDMGRKRRLNGGLKQLDIQSAKVWKPENLNR